MSTEGKSDTPETDHVTYIGFDIDDKGIECVTADFARKLERERDDLKVKCARLRVDNVKCVAALRKTTSDLALTKRDLELADNAADVDRSNVFDLIEQMAVALERAEQLTRGMVFLPEVLKDALTAAAPYRKEKE